MNVKLLSITSFRFITIVALIFSMYGQYSKAAGSVKAIRLPMGESVAEPEPPQRQPEANVLRLSRVNPWCSRRAEEWSKNLDSAKFIRLEGMGHDWLVAAAAVQTNKPMDATVQVEGPAELTAAVDVKVAGEVRGPDRDGKVTWWLDPLFSNPQRLGDLEKYVRNWAAIREFPRLHLRPDEPVMLWLTAKTHNLAPGEYKGYLTVTGSDGVRERLPLEILVHAVDLPVDNPIIGYGYQCFRDDRELAQISQSYGISACGYYENWDMCRELGFRYFKFNFPISQQKGASLDVSDKEIQDNLQPIREAVERLKLKPEEWGLEIYDEPFDQVAWAHVAWMIRIRRLWPEVQFWSNLGNAPGNNNFSTVKGIVEPFKPYVNTWCPYIETLPSLLPAIRETGQPSWYYVIEYRHGRPAKGGRNIPWLAWFYNLDGWAIYALGGDRVDPEKADWKDDNACARMYPDHTVSLWLEGLRQGVQDYKRLWRLQQSGMSRDQLSKLLVGLIPKGEDAPWGGADPPLYESIRQKLDTLLLEKQRTTSHP